MLGQSGSKGTWPPQEMISANYAKTLKFPTDLGSLFEKAA